MKKSGKITITSPVLEEVRARDDHKLRGAGRPGSLNSGALERDLSRYYALLRQALRSVNLTEGEASLICDALNGVWATNWGALDAPRAKQAILLELGDAIALNSLDQKWGVEEGPFAAKLEGFSEIQFVAILDAVERFWIHQDSTPASVGLCEEKTCTG